MAPAHPRGNGYAIRVRLGKGQRIQVMFFGSAEEAERRSVIIGDVGRRLIEAGAWQDFKRIAALIAKAKSERELRIAMLAAEEAIGTPGGHDPEMTFREFAQLWTSGELAEKYPDHVAKKRSVDDDNERLKNYAYPVVGDVPIARFELIHAKSVMATLPKRLAPSTRRHVAQLLHRVLSLAVFPAEVLKINPLPRGFLPKLQDSKAKGWLYPLEYRALLGESSVSLVRRVLYGFLAREGLRLGEALELRQSSIGWDVGAIRLDRNKTGDPRMWALSPGTLEALRLLGPKMFRELDGNKLAKIFRRDLKAAGVDRAELFESSATRQPIRIHDLRATFITLALANGRSEQWISDRTGHKSSVMIQRYRRAARSAGELGLGDLAPMTETIPELSESVPTPVGAETKNTKRER